MGAVIFVNPLYGEIGLLQQKAAAYNEALENSRTLEQERDKLTKKYNSISLTDLDRLSKLLPNNVDNIRLILEIEKIAGPYGMVLRDVKYNTAASTSTGDSGAVTQDASMGRNQAYGSWDLEFSTQGTYTNFIKFIQSLESNLRIVDIASVEFSSTSGAGSPIYRYTFRIKTYWLKD